KLIKEIRGKYPIYASLHYPKPVLAENLPLKEKEVLLEYALADDASYLFLVRKGGVQKLIKIPYGIEALEARVKRFIKPINPDHYKEFSIKEAKWFYDTLLAESLKDIKEDENIIIVPDGILGLLPFEALVIKEGTGIDDSTYVGDKYNITNSQSATILALKRTLETKEAEKPLFALGNPIFEDNDPRYIAYKAGKSEPTLIAQNMSQYSYRALATRREWGKTTEDDSVGEKLIFPPLHETEGEVKAIAKLFDVTIRPPDILLGINANETTMMKSQLADYRYIHLATHADLPGKVQGINEPFILLGQVENIEGDDGFLSLSEVLGMKLNADLVVLSACLTGRGEVMEGEGVVNFARAFQHAGAKSVLVSLWELASEPAVEYMTIFYGHLKSGKSKSEALKLAKSHMKQKYPNPYFWAVFILHGEG
ncbi:CHAT domain-containing protein, partial [bacterium]|nr:CHAT domain-containing protein [bacterium]